MLSGIHDEMQNLAATLRRALLALTVTAALAAALTAPVASARVAGTTAQQTARQRAADQQERGVVQLVVGVVVTIKELDGTSWPVVVQPQTAVSLNGQPASLEDVLPGAVAVVAIGQDGQALTVAVIDHRPLKQVSGLVMTVDPAALALRRLSGRTTTLATNLATRVYVNAQPASLPRVRSGCYATVIHVAGGPALELRAVCPKRG